MKNIVNLTAHTLNEMATGTEIPPSGIVARVEQNNVKVTEYNGIPVYKTEYGELIGLPEPKEGTIYIVSAMALNAVPEWRQDVYAPGYLKRNEEGIITGCIGFRSKQTS